MLSAILEWLSAIAVGLGAKLSNYAEEVPQDELAQRPETVWYVRRHGVYHPKKKSGLTALHLVKVSLSTQT